MNSAGLIGKDPIFKDTTNKDYRLKDNSPCKNAGDDGYDMGAYLGGTISIQDEETDKPGLIFQNQSNLIFRNPFFKTVTIGFKVFGEKANEYVTLKIYSCKGKHIRTLVSEEKVRGLYTSHWNGLDNFGTPVNAGMFFIRLQIGDYIETRIMIMMK